MDDVKAWNRQPSEPARWYQIFVKYYLAMGLRRSISGAYSRFLAEADPQEHEKHIASGYGNVPSTWRGMATRWSWRERAEAYEEDQTALVQAAVDEASRMLRLEAPHAVRALITALDEQRNRVPAANAILDRAGLPATTRQEIAGGMLISADDLATARKEMEEWESQRLQKEQSKSGSDAQSPAPTS